MTGPGPDQIHWRNASHEGGTCVDVGLYAGVFYIRDSKHPQGPMIPLHPTSYRALITAIKGDGLAPATTSTLRRKLITIPARIASSARRILLHLPIAWPWQTAFENLCHATHTPP